MAAGFAPQILRWDDAGAAWERFPLVLLRAPWDYFQRFAEFDAWLTARERQGARIWNPPHLVRWNADKRYLQDLAARGIPIVPTEFLAPPSGAPASPGLAEVLARRGWDEAVVKPAISAGAHLTARFKRADAPAHDALLHEIHACGVWALVQPFLNEVEREGEWSLFFFNRKLSHAVLKRPRPGDFRVQDTFGGTSVAVDPPASFRRAAERVIAAVPGEDQRELLYARVDGIAVGGELLLGELEIIEPSLFLAQAPHAAARFVEALTELVHVPKGKSATARSPGR